MWMRPLCQESKPQRPDFYYVTDLESVLTRGLRSGKN